jgi:hypothetical protein
VWFGFFVALVFVLVWLGNTSGGEQASEEPVAEKQQEQLAAESKSEPDKPVCLEFAPPFQLNDAQRDFIAQAKDVINNPAARGVYKPALNFDTCVFLELYMSVLWSENELSHYDDSGNVAWSYSGCCLGAGQVWTGTSVCSLKELQEPRYNIWCAAAIFKDKYEIFGRKAGDRANEITVAAYKDAVLYDEHGDLVLVDGIPVIPPNDPTRDDDLNDQVRSAFLYNGQSMFRFVTE